MIHTRPCPTCGQVHSVLVVCPTRQEKELLARETFEMAPAAVMGAAGPIGRIDPIGPYGRIALQTARETFGMAPTTCMRCGRALTALDGMHGLCETCDPNSFRNTAKAYDERRARELLAEEIRAAAFWECVVVAVEGSDGNPDELLARIAGLVQEWQVGRPAPIADAEGDADAPSFKPTVPPRPASALRAAWARGMSGRPYPGDLGAIHPDNCRNCEEGGHPDYCGWLWPEDLTEKGPR